MTSKPEPSLSPASPKGWQRVNHLLKQRGRATLRGLKRMTFRDWLQVAAVPLAIALLGIAGSFKINDYQKQQHQNDQLITKDQQQEAALQTYLDRMSDLILNGHLKKTTKDDEMRHIAHTRTMDVLLQLNGKTSTNQRKGEILRFLNDTGLIKTGSAIVDLRNADLSNTDLSAINLKDADLANVNLSNTDLKVAQMLGANLNNANLIQANLSGTNLSGTNLSGANLRGAIGVTTEQLNKAKSLQGTIMPNGSSHT